MRFSLIGLAGMLVQLASIWVTTRALGFHYLTATVLSVHVAVLHNFLWHLRWTWRDRPAPAEQLAGRFLRFWLTNGMISAVGNALLTVIFVECLDAPYVLAGLVSVSLCSAINFGASHLLVFRSQDSRGASTTRQDRGRSP